MLVATTTLHEHGAQGAFQGSRQSTAFICLVLLMAGDTAFVIVHLVNKYSPLLGNPLYSLGQDGGYGEMFQYLKYYWIAIMLGLLWSRTRERVYAAWMLLYAYLLCDDALGIHERAGGAIAELWGYHDALGLRDQDFGELTVSAMAGCVLAALISTLYLRAASEAKNVSKDLALLLGLLVFCGVFLDMLHMVVQGPLRGALAVAEDGGEMLVVSVVCWYVLNLLERRGDAPAWLWQTVVRIVATRRLRPG
jgi:hypothetical protein